MANEVQDIQSPQLEAAAEKGTQVEQRAEGATRMMATEFANIRNSANRGDMARMAKDASELEMGAEKVVSSEATAIASD